MSFILKYKNTLKSILSSNTDKILIVDNASHEIIKRTFTSVEIIGMQIICVCNINDVLSQEVCSNYTLLFFLSDLHIDEITNIINNYTNTIHIYYCNHVSPIISEILTNSIKKNVKSIYWCSLDFIPLSDYCVIGNKVFDALIAKPIHVVNNDDNIEKKLTKIIKSGLYNGSRESVALVVLNRGFDKITPLIVPWTYESMLHFHNIKLTQTNSEDDNLYNSLRYLEYDKVIQIVNTLVTELKEPNKNDPLAMVNYAEKKSIIEKHIDALHRLNTHISQNNIFKKSELEQKMITIERSDVLKSIYDASKKTISFATNNKLFGVNQIQQTDNTTIQISLDPEFERFAKVLDISEKNYQSDDKPIFTQYIPKIKKIMEQYDSKFEHVYIYIDSNITYREIAEVELFNRTSKSKFYLLSDNIKNYWEYNCFAHNEYYTENFKIIPIYISQKNITEDEVMQEITNNYIDVTNEITNLKTLLGNPLKYDSALAKGIIEKVNDILKTKYSDIELINAITIIEKNKKAYQLIKIKEVSIEFKKWVKRYEEMEAKIHKMNKWEIELHAEMEEESQKFMSQQKSITNDIYDHNAKIIDERLKEFQNIHTGLMNINKMYVDLNIIISAQAKILENVYDNIVRTDDFVKKATVELKSAVTESKKGTKLGMIAAITTGCMFVLGAFGLAKS